MTMAICPSCKTRPAENDRALCGECAERSAGQPASPRTDRTYQEPLLLGGVYHCPRCRAPLDAGAKGCGVCLVEFMRPAPEARLTQSGASALPRSVARTKSPPWGAFVGVALLLAALGFGFHAYKASTIVTHPLATRLRVFHKGDSWEYRASGIVTVSGGMAALLGEGSAMTLRDGTVRSVISAAFPEEGSHALNTCTQDDTMAVTFSYRGRGTPITSVDHKSFSQDPVRATTCLLTDEGGPNKSARRVLLPKVDIPGVWSDGLTQAVRLDFDDNESTDETMTVQGPEVVDTALGRFTVWRCVEGQTYSNGIKASRTFWFAPQLGMPVKILETLTATRALPTTETLPSLLAPAFLRPGDPITMVLTMETEITKTNVPLD